MRHLFQSWPDFLGAVEASSHILLLADYDGTLTDIVGRPDDAKLSESVRGKLTALAHKLNVSTGVISGRELAELKGLVNIDGIYYAGNHGMEIEGPGLDYINPEAEAARPVITALGGRLAEAMENIDGVIIQVKGFSVSVHYRLIKPEDEAAVSEAVKSVTAPYVAGGEIKVYPMKKVWEIRPPLDWDKGKAVLLIGQQIRDALKVDDLLTVYLGDDTTDEDAFRVLHLPNGWSVFVTGEKTQSAADYYLDSVAEVGEFLDRLIKLEK